MIDETEAYSLGLLAGMLQVQGEKLDRNFNVCVTSDLFDDTYLSEEYDRGLQAAGADPATWDDESEDESEVQEELQIDLFREGPGHPGSPTEDGVYLILVNGTPGLYSRFVSTMGWSHPSAIRKDLDRGTLPFIGWPYWNWAEIEE